MHPAPHFTCTVSFLAFYNSTSAFFCPFPLKKDFFWPMDISFYFAKLLFFSRGANWWPLGAPPIFFSSRFCTIFPKWYSILNPCISREREAWLKQTRKALKFLDSRDEEGIPTSVWMSVGEGAGPGHLSTCGGMVTVERLIICLCLADQQGLVATPADRGTDRN